MRERSDSQPGSGKNRQPGWGAKRGSRNWSGARDGSPCRTHGARAQPGQGTGAEGLKAQSRGSPCHEVPPGPGAEKIRAEELCLCHHPREPRCRVPVLRGRRGRFPFCRRPSFRDACSQNPSSYHQPRPVPQQRHRHTPHDPEPRAPHRHGAHPNSVPSRWHQLPMPPAMDCAEDTAPGAAERKTLCAAPTAPAAPDLGTGTTSLWGRGHLVRWMVTRDGDRSFITKYAPNQRPSLRSHQQRRLGGEQVPRDSCARGHGHGPSVTTTSGRETRPWP